MLSFLLGSALVSVSAGVVTAWLRFQSALDRSLAFATLACAQIVVSVLVAGFLLHDLDRGAVLATTAVCALVVSVAFVLQSSRSLRSGLRPGILQSLGRSVTRDLWATSLVVLAALAVAWRAAIAIALPPYGWDALWYHLTTVAEWMQAGKIESSALVPRSGVYTYNGELLFTWPSLLLHDDVLTGLVQLGVALAGAAAVAGIARITGVSSAGAAAAGALYLLTPIVLAQASTDYVDVVFASFIVASVYFLLRAFAAPSARGIAAQWRLLLVGGLAAGLAVGTKPDGLIYAALLWATVLVNVVLQRRRASTSAPLLGLTAFTVPLVAFGAFWFIRAWVVYGNPLYPVSVRVLGIPVFAGPSTLKHLLTPTPGGGPVWKEVLRQWHGDLFGIVSPHDYTEDGRGGGFGPQWAYLALPLIPVFAVQLSRRRPAVALNLLLVAALIFALQPYKWWSRFTIYPIAVIGVLALVYVIEHSPRTISVVLKVASLLLVCVGLWYSSVNVFPGFGVVLRPARVAQLLTDRPSDGELLLPQYRWVDGIDPHAAVSVDTETGASGFGDDPAVLFFYPLFGRHFRHDVYPLRGRTPGEIAGRMRTEDARYAFVAAHGRFDRLLSSAACFKRIFTGQGDRTYALRSTC